MSTTIINVTIDGNIAIADPSSKIVCDNKSVYEVEFKFDSMWDDQPVKTARFIYNDHIVDEPITGNRAKIPRVIDATTLYVGVYADDIQTSTPATVECLPSILGRRGTPPPPSDDVYSKIIALIKVMSGDLIIDIDELPSVEGASDNAIYRLREEIDGKERYSLYILAGRELKEIKTDYSDFATQEQLKDYLNKKDLSSAVDSALTTAKESGEFDGQDGADGISVTKAEINTDGELVLTFSDGSTTNVGRVVGADGASGTNGTDGANGTNGVDGTDGVGIASIKQTTTSTEDGGTNVVTVTLTNGNTATFEVKNGSKGSDGTNGADGKDGEDGKTPYILNGYWYIGDENTGVKAEGFDGVNGTDGKDGVDGTNGKDGLDGVFIGTMTAYEEAYAAGLIPVGCIVIIDDTSTTAVLGKAVLGQMVLGTI